MDDGPVKLPPFPVDDAILANLEHAMGAALVVTDAGEHEIVGADFSVPRLLDFLSGYDPAKLRPLTEEPWRDDIQEYPDATYTRDDVIRALIREVRRLRKA